MSKSSNRIRDFFGGLIALSGASLVAWQAVLVYYLIIGRVEVGEEHPPFTVIAIMILIGAFLVGAGYKISRPSKRIRN
ncbi:hypothetical protein [Neptunomonas sp.]|uniref:hypothetical protein n=1 Tax=Neptunomonas sp. TaxID=1971898 RepID=UPI003568E0A9